MPERIGTHLSAGVVNPEEARFTIPIGRDVSERWHWHDLATPDNREEYDWKVRISNRYSVGFALFRFPGASPQQGSFDQLLHAGQADIAAVTPRGGSRLRGLEPELHGDGGALVVEVRGKGVIATLFSDHPHDVVMETGSPYTAHRFITVPVVYGSSTTGRAPARDDSPVQTDSLVYHLQRTPYEYRAQAIATFVNRTATPVYFQRCNEESTTPEYSVRGTGVDSTKSLFPVVVWACVGGVPYGEIAPNDSIRMAVHLGSADQPTMQPPLRPEQLVGLMRVTLGLCRKSSANSDSCDSMPVAQRTSNAFLVSY